MRLLAAVGLLAAIAFAPPAAAQRGGPGTIECHSPNFQPNECDSGFRQAQLVRQISRAPCIEGETWGIRRGVIWVSDGCAAEFAAVGRPGGGQGWGGGGGAVQVECRSEDHRFARCGNSRAPARLLRQISRAPCVEGRTWGVDRDGLWVDQGCAAVFQQGGGGGGSGQGHGGDDYRPPADAEFVTCQSQRGRPETCRFRSAARHVGLLQNLTEVPCEEGVNWDWQERSVRVWDGCAATFRVFPR
jgi:hypothetical protein